MEMRAQIASIHNLSFYIWLAKEARKHIVSDTFHTWKCEIKEINNRLKLNILNNYILKIFENFFFRRCNYDFSCCCYRFY